MNLGHLRRLLTYCPRDSISKGALFHSRCRCFNHIFLNNQFTSGDLVVDLILFSRGSLKGCCSLKDVTKCRLMTNTSRCFRNKTH